MSLNEIPALPGSYALLLHLDHALNLPVGCLGTFCFPAAEYLYFGSACGPGGLRARLLRHVAGSGRPHWHIDSFRSLATLETIFFLVTPGEAPPSPARLECIWSQAAARLPSAFVPVPRFGASDCRQSCSAHLIGLNELPVSLAGLLAQVADKDPSAISIVHLR